MLQEGADLPGTPLSGSVPLESSAPSPHSGSYSAAYQQRVALADPDSCKLEMFVACNRTRLLYDLMKAVDKDEVTQVCDTRKALRTSCLVKSVDCVLPVQSRFDAGKSSAV
jgi:hypothetical protein